MNIKKLKSYLPIVMTRNHYEKIVNDKKEIQKKNKKLSIKNDELDFELCDVNAAFELCKKEKKCLEEQIESLNKKINQRDKDLEKNLLEKEEFINQISTFDKKLISNKANLAKVSSHLEIANKQINKLEKELDKKIASNDAKQRVIEEYKLAIEQYENRILDLESMNKNQQEKIQKLNKETTHMKEEYQQDGLPKHTKKILELSRKRRRK